MAENRRETKKYACHFNWLHWFLKQFEWGGQPNMYLPGSSQPIVHYSFYWDNSSALWNKNIEKRQETMAGRARDGVKENLLSSFVVVPSIGKDVHIFNLFIHRWSNGKIAQAGTSLRPIRHSIDHQGPGKNKM